MAVPVPDLLTREDLLEQALEMPDLESRKRLFRDHASLLDDECAEALKAQADLFLRSDTHQALETAALLLYQAELTGDPLHRALGLLAEGNAQSIGLGEYEQGLDLYDEAAAIYQANGCPVRRARSQIGKIYALGRLGRYKEVLETGEWVSRILEENDRHFLLAGLCVNLGINHSRIGQDAESLAQYDRARELYIRSGEEVEPYLPWVDHNRAVSLRNLGQFEAALQAAQQALETLAYQGQKLEAARAQQNMALTYYVLGRYNEALELYENVRDIFLDDGRQRDATLVDLFVSDCLLQLRRYADVLERCGRIRGRFVELGTQFEAGQALLNEAVANAGLGRDAEALSSLAEARQVFALEGNEVWIARSEIELAALLLRQGNLKESVAQAGACASVFQTHGMPVQEAQAHLIAARALSGLGQHDLARVQVSRALAEAGKRDVPSLTYQCHHLLGTLAERGGDVEQALTNYDLAIGELERLRGRLMVEFRADFLEDKQLIYEEMVDLCLDLDRPSQALEYAERAKSRALLDLLAYRLDLSVQVRREADRPLVEELVRLRSERDRRYRRWEGREETGDEDWATADESRQQTRRDVLALEKQITGLWHRILIRNADYARDAALWQVRVEPIQPYLDPDMLLLEYFADEQMVVFSVTRDNVRADRLPGDPSQVQNLLQLLWLNLKMVPMGAPSQGPALKANAQGLLQRLHQLLIAPLGLDPAVYPRLIIVPHGPLHYLPFHALYDGSSYLLEGHEISYLPAASLLRYCCEAQVAESGLLALGDSHGGRLPHAVQEARTIAQRLGGRAFVETEATLERLRVDASACRTIHLAAHGEFRPDNPLFSGLALADGWLTTLDIFDLRLRASLVCLSACQTGRSVVGGGDEVQGLMRALLHAGAASVVLTLWSVEDHTTAGLMDAFYSKLAEGWTKGAALQHAQQAFLNGQRPWGADMTEIYTHPYYWAPFFLVGEAGAL